MKDTDDTLWYLAIGPLAAIVLGSALIPFRDLTSASNLAFVFLILVIVVGHGGGRWPAIATAVASSLSLNFFLTRPYLTLVINSADDIVAFLGLTTCGLVAATLGTRRVERFASERQLVTLFSALRRLETAGPAEPHAEQVLEEAVAAFPVSALALRDSTERLVVAVGDRTRLAVPAKPTDEGEAPDMPERIPDGVGRVTALSSAGMRLPLVFFGTRVGSLDLWGDGRPARRSTKRTLRAVARVVAAMLAASAPRAVERERPPATRVGGSAPGTRG